MWAQSTPDNHLILGNRCQTYLKVDKVPAALRDAERAVEIAPEWAKGQYRLGVCLQRSEQHEEAVAAFERACDLDPGNAEARKGLGEAREKLGAWLAQQDKLSKARKRTTIRQAADLKACAEYEAKVEAKKAGKIKEMNEWGGELAAEWEKQYTEEIGSHLPAGELGADL